MRPPIPFTFMPDLPLAWHLGELKRLSSAGIPVLLDVDTMGADEATQCLELMLHDPDMATPVEPFGSLLQALVEKQPMALWDLTFLERSGEAEVFRTLPKAHPECLACACFPICAGYATQMGSCATWQALIPRLAAAARALGRLRQEQEAPGNSRGFVAAEREELSPP